MGNENIFEGGGWRGKGGGNILHTINKIEN